MRRLRYSVAASLDGFIAGPSGEYDWITPDPSYDFLALFRQFDTLLMGRRTYELALTRGQSLKAMGMKVFVVSTTLKASEHADVTIVTGDVAARIAALKAEPGKDIWLFGGAILFRTLLDAGLVDTVEIAVIPILLGSGLKLMPEGARCHLRLEKSEQFPNGTLALRYAIQKAGV